MFRLSEALASLEPENASRLRLALKFSREELILAQMKETQGLLKEAQLAKAETEARELLAKLEHLRRLLLAEDLDFQMKLARLRQMRETMAQLDRIINEEKRELSWSRKAVDDQGGLSRFRDRKADLEALVRDQKAAVNDTLAAAGKGDAAARKEARRVVGDGESAIRKRAASLASDPRIAALRPEHLKQGDPHLEDAIAHLAAGDIDNAVADERRALDAFRKSLDAMSARLAEAEKEVAPSAFQKNEARPEPQPGRVGLAGGGLGPAGRQRGRAPEGPDPRRRLDAVGRGRPGPDRGQARGRGPARGAQAPGQVARQPGPVDGGTLTELEIRAPVAHPGRAHRHARDAEGDPRDDRGPGPAHRQEVAHGRAPGGGALAQGGRARRPDRSARPADRGDGVRHRPADRAAGPPREMRIVQGWLAESDASPRTVKMEKRVEEDLLSLLEAMRRLPRRPRRPRLATALGPAGASASSID